MNGAKDESDLRAFGDIWVLGEAKPSGELASTVFELTAKARELADDLSCTAGTVCEVKVILILDSAVSGEARPLRTGYYGADRVIAVSGERLPADRAASARVLAHLAAKHRPAVIMAAATAFGRSVMPYAAALLKTGLTADCTGLSIDFETGLLLQTRPAIGGNIMATIRTPYRTPQMATVRPRTFRVPAPRTDRRAILEYPDIPDEVKIRTVTTVSFKEFDERDGALRERDVIVSGGKGLRRAEGFGLISKLASLLGGGVGASRPVVEMKWISYPHQVGLSGQTVSPKVCIVAGISGAVQHLAGIQTSGRIIAINRDPEAQIFGVSDVAICGDLYEVIPLLIERIERRRGISK
ncbi:MAG: electron transfer flavoprotein subunit alpha/FixB family protein [Synergistaceae bacterium]|jgi:electron transfer flavoprotein alpha subunit|nr:electron transfer flavoprotein subunit alpha/FixB family protein [Synergistaceae bacterium]